MLSFSRKNLLVAAGAVVALAQVGLMACGSSNSDSTPPPAPVAVAPAPVYDPNSPNTGYYPGTNGNTMWFPANGGSPYGGYQAQYYGPNGNPYSSPFNLNWGNNGMSAYYNGALIPSSAYTYGYSGGRVWFNYSGGGFSNLSNGYSLRVRPCMMTNTGIVNGYYGQAYNGYYYGGY